MSGAAARRFSFSLTPEEAALISRPAGSGGHQGIHRRLSLQLAAGQNVVELDDRQFGELVRHITQYGSGGYQGRLRKAFDRSLRELLGH